MALTLGQSCSLAWAVRELKQAPAAPVSPDASPRIGHEVHAGRKVVHRIQCNLQLSYHGACQMSQMSVGRVLQALTDVGAALIRTC